MNNLEITTNLFKPNFETFGWSLYSGVSAEIIGKRFAISTDHRGAYHHFGTDNIETLVNWLVMMKVEDEREKRNMNGNWSDYKRRDVDDEIIRNLEKDVWIENHGACIKIKFNDDVCMTKKNPKSNELKVVQIKNSPTDET